MIRPLPVLFTHFGEEWIRGRKQVLLDLLRHIDRSQITPIVRRIDIDLDRIPPPRQHLRSLLGIPQAAPVIATVGSLVHRKAHDLLLRAVAALPAATPDARAHLLIGSDGEARGEGEALARELGIGDRAHFLGSTDTLCAIYEAADIVAFPSRADAFGLVVAEPGHLGLPVVPTGVGGIAEVIIDGETSVLVPPEDVPALQAARRRLIATPDLRATMGAAARRRSDHMFTAARMAARFTDCSRRLAERMELPRPRPRPYASPIRVRPTAAPDARGR